MPVTDALLAIDLGAESGRAVSGRFNGTRLQLEEVLRFPNQPVAVGETLYWDILDIFANVEAAIEKARASGGLRSVGIDTWGVDFGLLDRCGRLVANPIHYRDRRTEGMMQRAFEIVPREEIFSATGNMFLELNTLYQLLALRLADDPTLEIADRMLNTPDLLHYWLSGVMAHELTIASTTQCLAANRTEWAWDLLCRLDIPARLFGDIVPPGTRLGSLRARLWLNRPGPPQPRSPGGWRFFLEASPAPHALSRRTQEVAPSRRSETPPIPGRPGAWRRTRRVQRRR